MRQPDHHNEIQLNILVTGRLTYLVGGRTVTIRTGHLTVFWAAIPHQIIDFDPATEYYVATIPLAWFLQSQMAEALVQPLMQGEVVEEPAERRGAMDAALFVQWAEDLRQRTTPLREIVAQEMRTRLQRLSLALTHTRQAVGGRRPRKTQMSALNKVEQMVCYIAQNYMDTLTAEDIGRACGLHPNSAMRLFKKTFGRTLVDHLTHHRIFHAKRLLATTDRKIVDIAFSSGFNSISRFNEAFRRACKCTPRTYRQSHETADALDAAELRPVGGALGKS